MSNDWGQPGQQSDGYDGFDDELYSGDDDRLDDDSSPGEGCFHVKCLDVQFYQGNNRDQMVLDMVVLSDGAYTGCIYRHWVKQSADEWPRKIRSKMAIVLGLTTAEALRRGGVKIDWKAAIGRECAIVIKAEEYEKTKDDGTTTSRTTYKAKWPEQWLSLGSVAALKKHGFIPASRTGGSSSTSHARPVEHAPPAAKPAKDDDLEF